MNLDLQIERSDIPIYFGFGCTISLREPTGFNGQDLRKFSTRHEIFLFLTP